MPFPSDVYEWTRHRYGLQLLAYVIHNIIKLHIPQTEAVWKYAQALWLSTRSANNQRLEAEGCGALSRCI